MKAMKQNRLLPVFLAAAVLVLTAALFAVAFGEEVLPEDLLSEIIFEEEVNPDFPSWVDEDSLAENYINEKMPHAMTFRASRFTGLSLPSPTKELYQALRNSVVRVSCGEITSTVFYFPLDSFIQMTFTLEELAEDGVEAILDEDGLFTEAAETAAKNRVEANRTSIDYTSAIRCLLADTPFELYWYNKAKGGGTTPGYTKLRTVSYNSTSITLKGSIVMMMSVSKNYALKSTNASGEEVYETYQVDPIYGASVQAAAKNAAKILSETASLDDYTKLVRYRDAICALTAYNTPAVQEGWDYGNPWQLIWVFDGNEDTKVVCEGYAKAFKYLADLGTSSALVSTVQGYLKQKSGRGAHMWNIVSLDGHNYLVDVTNCDKGSYGSEVYFMKGCTDGDVATGYTFGSVSFLYGTNTGLTEEDLTLASCDYTVWKAAIEKAPQADFSSLVTCPGYVPVLRLLDENMSDPLIAPSFLRVHFTADPGDEATLENQTEEIVELPITGEWLPFPYTGTVYFTVLRDGIESPASESVTISVSPSLLPENFSLFLSGMTIEEEAFSGNEALLAVSLTDCAIASSAFSDCENLTHALLTSCTLAADSFDPGTLLCLDSFSSWPIAPFILLASGEE